MATLQKIRDRGGILVAVVIGLALIAFILGDFLQSGTSLFNRGRLEVGSVGGESIQYPDFQKRVDELTSFYSQQQLTEDMRNQLSDQVWDEMIKELIMSDAYENLGLAVSDDELTDMLIGDNIHPTVQQVFADPTTGQFDINYVIEFLKNMDEMATIEQRNYWLYLEDGIVRDRLMTKYNNLIGKAIYVTDTDAKNNLESKNHKVNFEYIKLDYTSIPDSQAVVTEKDLRAYYDAHKSEFTQTKSRKIEYVTFHVEPSQADSEAAQKWISDIKPDFERTTDNIQFVNSNSDEPFIDIWYKQTSLPEDIAQWIFEDKAEINDVYGPYFQNEAYRLVKLNAYEMMPDSVEARHILLNVNNAFELDSIQHLADSLKTLIEKGADFAALARQYSKDPGSAGLGGDLGWFGRGAMVKPFEEAAFNNKEKEVSIATSQFGIHIIQTTKRGVLSPQVQIAILERKVAPGNLTYQNYYAKASKFVTENTTREKFEEAVKNEGLTKKEVTIRETDRSLTGFSTASRPLIRAAFDSKVGSIVRSSDGSPIFEVGDDFIVAVLTEIFEEGTAPFEAVRTSVELAAEKDKKAQILIDKINKASDGNNMTEIAGRLGTSVGMANDIAFSAGSVPGITGSEPALIAVASSLAKDEMSKPIKGNNSVFLAKVIDVTENNDMDFDSEKNRMMQILGFRISSNAPYEALKKAAEVEDNRSKFY